MIKYDPVKLELSTRDVVARANFQEIQEGRGTKKGGVYLDISHRSKEYILERLPKMHSMILKYNGIDISEKAVEVAPTTHYTMGGIYFDPKTFQTNLAGFFVAGECTMGVHGANRLGGNSLMETMVFGKKVAQALIDLQEEDVVLIPDMHTGIELNERGIDGNESLLILRKKIWNLAGIVRNKEDLGELQAGIESIRKTLMEKGMMHVGSRYEDIMTYTRLRTVIHIGLMICSGALQREESRGAHFRSDYPDLNQRFSKNYMQLYKDNKFEQYRQDVGPISEELKQGLNDFERTQNYGYSE